MEWIEWNHGKKDAVLAHQGSGKEKLSLSYEYSPSGLDAKIEDAKDDFYGLGVS